MTPNVGDSGVFSVAAPFTNNQFFSRSLTVLSLTSFASLIADGKEPYTLYYEPYGLTVEDYRRDVANKEAIVLFSSKNEDQYSLPTSYVLSIPQGSGEEYVNVSVVVQLPAMWSNIAYNHYLEALGELTRQMLGVYADDIEMVAIGESEYKTDIEHITIEAERNVIRQDAGNNMLVELTQLRERVVAQREQLNILEAYILSQT